MELYQLAESCDYGALRDEMACHRLVVGIRDAGLSQQLQLDSELTLEKAKKKIWQKEAVGKQQKELKASAEGTTSLEELCFCRKPKKGQHPHRNHASSGRPKATPTNATHTTKACTHCGREPHPHEKCPTKDANCDRCTKKGHYSSQCFTKQVSEVSSENVLDTAFLDTVRGEQTSAWFTTIKPDEQQTRFKLDTGAEVTAISEQSYLSLQNSQLSAPEKTLTTAPEHPWTVLGKIFAQWKGGQTVCVWGGWSQDEPSRPTCHHCPGISHSS